VTASEQELRRELDEQQALIDDLNETIALNVSIAKDVFTFCHSHHHKFDRQRILLKPKPNNKMK
jgi:hypothetical protein